MTEGRMTLDLDGGRWSAAVMAMAFDIAVQADLALELASRSTAPHPLARRLLEATGATRIVVDGPVVAYAVWSGSTLLATCGGRDHEPRPVPVLTGGRRLVKSRHYDRIVVGIDATPAAARIVEVADALATTLGAHLVLIEIVDPAAPAGEVPDSAHLHHISARLSHRQRDYDTLRAADPAAALLRHVGDGTGTIIAIGGSRATKVARRLLRSSRCPVLLLPQRSLGDDDGHGDGTVVADRHVPSRHLMLVR